MSLCYLSSVWGGDGGMRENRRRERERERETKKQREKEREVQIERERDREKDTDREKMSKYFPMHLPPMRTLFLSD
jgi:hypothetical protein